MKRRGVFEASRYIIYNVEKENLLGIYYKKWEIGGLKKLVDI